ncbi:MAG: ABC transporter permease [Firmicutes bacterium]|nr:ABC transporter permease [Bacillota bacterium]
MRKSWKQLDRLGVALASIVLGLVVGIIFILVAGKSPILGYHALWNASFGSLRGFTELLINTTPLIFTGLSVAFAFRTGLFNIGAEGQYIVGQLGAAWAGYFFTGLPMIIHVPLALGFGILAGALWGALPGYLKAKAGAHEVINTIMMNHIALYATHYLVNGPLKGHAFLPVTKEILDSAKLFRFIPGTRANIGIFIALAAAVFVYWFLWKTTKGYELRAVGFNPLAAEYGGVNVSRNIVYSMMIAGALAGLGGAVQVLSIQYKFYDVTAFIGYGFDGIAVALIGNNHPLGVVLGAFLFGFLARGAMPMQSIAQIPKEVISIVSASIIIFISAEALVRRVIPRFSKKGGVKDANL